ncbi:HECT-domain-containing protein [Pseudocohnilembus persalinus]|uniref:HECT-domain-containing protein n=1 Tax=Pseudocohnilembus persalinus TaxID=266149 RepID=A0A0V0QGL5_PSEPJ|nr:HECT-domain-containing protein [Pseudocohnilembus persalinus]|eukprot:KRX01353.1 HECT-domain-containing protein [Pseudocohnilembus persalinus]
MKKSQSFAYDKGGQFSYNKLSISAMLNKIKSQYEETYNQFQEKYKKQSKKLKEKLSQQVKEKAEQKQDKQEKLEVENNKSKEVKANETKSKNEGFVNLTQIIRLTQSNFLEQEELQNVRQSFNKQKALELAQLIQLCIDDKIEQLQIPGKMDNEFKKKIDPILIWKNIGGNQSQASYAPHLGNEVKNIQILICKKEYVNKIESDKLNFSKLYNKYTISKRNSKNAVKKLANESPFINDFVLTGQGQQQILDDLVKFWKEIIDKNENLKNIVQNQLQQIMKDFNFQQEQLEKLNKDKNQDGQEQVQQQNNLFIGFLTILGGWEDVPQPYTQFYHQQQQQYITILQGGNQSGIQDYKVVKQNSENVEHIVMEQELVEDAVLIEQNIQNTNLINKIFKNKEMIQQFIKILSYLAQNSLLNKKDAENQDDKVNNHKDLWQLYALKSIMKISKYLNWEKLIVNVENNQQVKQLIQILKDIYQKNNRTSTQLKEDKQQFLLNWGSYIEKRQEIFNQAFLPTFDCVHKNLQKYLKNKPQNSVQRVNQKQDQDQNLDQDQNQNLNQKKEKEVENCTDYTIMSSPYNSSLPEANEQIQENKLLKYWEKHVIPKIIDFVKSSFKAYEMEEFFEQMRIPLRQGDQDKAAQVAYILCDQRLPAGVTLFDSNYDWSSITIEDVKIGQHVLVKIGNNKNMASKYFQESKDLQLDYVCCQVMGYDSRYNMVLVLFKNQLNNKLVTQWVEINRLKKVQSIVNSNSFFSDIQEKQIVQKLQKSLMDLISQLARQTLIKFSQSSSAVKRQNNNNNDKENLNFDMQQKQTKEIKQKQQHCLNLNENYRYLESLNLEFIEIMKWSIQQEFSSNPLISWRDSQKPINQYFRQYQDNKEIQKQLQYVGNQNSENKLDQLYEQLLEQVQKINIKQNLEKDNKCEYDIIFDKLLDYCQLGMEKMVDIIMNNYYKENLFQENPIKLNKFQNISEIGSIILVFQSNSQLCQASGLIFSKDQQGANTIKTIFTKKQSLRNIQPLIFNGSDIYCTYYFNAEALPPYERLQISQDTKLECLVYGVPNEWNVLCWLIENISSAITQTYQNLTCENQKNANLEVLKRLNALLFKTFQKLKGPNILRQILSQMITRVTRKIQHILSQNEIKIIEGKSNLEQQIQLLGGNLEFVQYLIQEIQQIKNSQIQNDIHLYSSYLQDQIEMASTLLIPQFYQMKEINGNKSQEKCLFLQNLPLEFEFKGEQVKIPDFIIDFTNLQILTNYLMQNQWHQLNNSTSEKQNNQYDQSFQHESKFLSQEMFENITENLFVKSGIQLQNIQDFEQYLNDKIIENSIIIKDMPSQILQENSEQFIQLLEKQGHKIFNQDTDIYQEEQEEKFKNLLIFTDGKINKQNGTLEEEEDEKQEEAKQPEEQKEIEGPVTYNCAMCTFENLWTNQNCEICEAPRPAEPPKRPKIEQQIEEDQEQLKQKEMEKKRKKKEKEVKKLKDEIQKFIHTQLLEQSNDLKELEQKKIQLKEEIEEIKQKIENQFKFKSNELISELIKEQDNNLLMDKQAELTKLFKLNYEQLVRQTSSQREEEKRKKLEKEHISEISEKDIKEEAESEEDSSEEKKNDKQITVDEEVDLEKLVENQEISDKEKLKKKEEELENIFNEIEEKKVLIDSLVPEIFIGDASLKSVKNLAMDYLNAKIIKSESGELHQNVKSVLYNIQVQSQQINNNVINNIEQEFFGEIIKNSNEIQKMTKQDENKNLSVFEDSRILINIFQQLANQNIIKAWQLLFIFGYDLHLSQSKFTFKELPQIISKKGIKELLQFIEFDVLHKSSDILEFTSDGIRFQEFNEQKRINYMDSESTLLLYKNLKEEKEKSLKNVRYSWEILRYFNSLLNKMIQYTNLDNFNDNKWINNLILSKTSGQQQQSKNLILNTGSYISRLKNLWMVPIKTSLIQKVLQNTAVNRESVPKVTISRIKLASKRTLIQREQQEQNNISEINQDIKKTETSMIHNNQKDLFIFTKAYEQLKKIHPSKLRPVKPQGTEPFLSFEIKLQGERAQGLSGPYRQFFSDISDELQPKQQGERQLGLLIPTPNNVFNLGDYRDKFMINPEAQSQYQLELLQFLGILMGTCLRTGVHLTLDLPKVFWKQMTNQEIEFQDLVDVDMQLMNLKKLLENSTQEMFEEPSFIETIKECLDSLKQKSQIKTQNLEAEKIEFQNRYVLLQRVADKIHKQNQNQIDAIKKGLYSILPKPLIKIFSATDLEEFVCGKKDVDLQLLKRHTNYSGDLNENSQLVNYFWEGLEEFTNEQRLRFVKFCWGQERLPNNDIEFERNQIRFMLKPSMNKNQNQKIQDQLLPKADTCFFNLELPNYSSKEILKQRLLIAISFGSDAIDGDQEIQLDDYQNGYLGGRVGRNQEYDSEDDEY